jgi:hypothetical protein
MESDCTVAIHGRLLEALQQILAPQGLTIVHPFSLVWCGTYFTLHTKSRFCMTNHPRRK